jgi:hypothetical protein
LAIITGMCKELLLAPTVVLVAIAGCGKPRLDLNGYPCENGTCATGYVCHPEKSVCVPEIRIGCDEEGAICPSALATGDPCPAKGAFVPCQDHLGDCSAGCRTCQEDLTWGACPPACVIGTIENCSVCGDNCALALHVAEATCDTSGANPACKIVACEDGFVDADPLVSGCECEAEGSELCNDADDNCDGEVDNFSSLGAMELACKSEHPFAPYVTEWACNGRCEIVGCATGHWNLDGDVDDGCEYACVKSGDEVCNGIDDDCDGARDDMTGAAIDLDCGNRNSSARFVERWGCFEGRCIIVDCVAGYSDAGGGISDGCESGCVATVPTTEVCDGVDNDCDGTEDNEDAVGCTLYYRDDDRDGFGQSGDGRCLCAGIAPYDTEDDGDCDDNPAGCGASCFPGNTALDRCDGLDANCNGTEGESDPLLGTACDGPDKDLCPDDEYIGCVGGELICSTGDDDAESPGDGTCEDTIDNDCDGYADCSDADCLGLPACSVYEDEDKDGVTTAADCDDGIPTCKSDCMTNTDAASESQLVVDCVEEFCGSDPAVGSSFCRLVTSEAELNTAIMDSNSRPGKDYMLLNGDVRVTYYVPDFAGPDGIEVHQRVGKVIYLANPFGSYNPVVFLLAGDHNIVDGVTVSAESNVTMAVPFQILGNDNEVRNATVATNWYLSGAVAVYGNNNSIDNIRIEHDYVGASNTGTYLTIGGDHNTVDGVKVQSHVSPSVNGIVSVVGSNAVVTDVVATVSSERLVYGIYVSGPDALISDVDINSYSSSCSGLSQYGLYVTSSGADTVVDRLRLAYGCALNYGVYVGANDTSVDHLTLEAAAPVQYGIYTDRVESLRFSNVSVDFQSSVGYYGIYSFCRQSNFENIYMRFAGSTGSGGVYVDADRNSFAHMTLDFLGNTPYGVMVWPDAFATVLDALTINYSANITNDAVRIYGSSTSLTNCLIADATPSDPATGTARGVYIYAGSWQWTGDDVTVANCTIAGFKQQGILVSVASYPTYVAERNLLYNNLIYGGTDAAADGRGGIVVQNAIDTRIVGNVVVNNQSDGLQLIRCRTQTSDPSHITFIDHNTLAYNSDGIDVYGDTSVSLCARNNIFSNNLGAAIRYSVNQPATFWAKDDARCTGSLVDGYWGNVAPTDAAAKNAYRCQNDARCNVGSECSCLTMGATNFFQYSTNPAYQSIAVTDPTYYCVSPSTAPELIDSGAVLGPTDPLDPLYRVYDLNGTAPGQFTDAPAVAGNGPDIGARESGAQGCP